MATAIIMPKYEMAQEEGTIALWLKAEGDAVKKGEAVLEVETDKVTMEVEAPADGILRGIRAREGEVVAIGKPIAYLVAPDEAWSPDGEEEGEAAGTSGDVRQAARTAAVSGRGAQPVQEEPRATPVARRMAREHDVDLATMTEQAAARIRKEDVRSYLDKRVQDVGGGVRAVPAARRLARREGVDLREVTGSGPGGRIQSDDVRGFSAAARESAVEPSAEREGGMKGRAVPLGNVRQTTARRMTSSVREAPQFALSVDVSMERALQVVVDLNEGAEDEAARVTVTAFLVLACGYALKRHPEVNASYDDRKIMEWEEINVGVAVAIEDGLVVPVLRGVDTIGCYEISRNLGDVVRRARDRRLQQADLARGTFTLSNLGMFSVDQFTAIVNPPQAAILAVGRIRKVAVVDEDDAVRVQRMANLTLTVDHRVLDGAGAARFLTTLTQGIERPGLLLS